MEKEVSEAMPLMTMSYDTIYEHAWTEKRRSKVDFPKYVGQYKDFQCTPDMGEKLVQLPRPRQRYTITHVVTLLLELLL